MDPLLLTRLRQTNPWLFGEGRVTGAPVATLPSPHVSRLQVDSRTFSRVDRAHLVIGPRQAGKSTLAWSWLRGLERPLFVNAEEPVLRAWCTSAAGFLADVTSLGGVDAIFLEEAQWLEEGPRFAKGLVDARPGVPVLVTGSASFHLLGRTRETLAGRASRHRLLPLSLAEVAPGDGSPPALLQARRTDALERMLSVGGYPEAWLSEDPGEILGGLLQAFVLRDASDLFRVERLDAYQALLQLVAGQVGQLLVVSELASRCGVSAATALRYLELMEEAHVLQLLPSYAGGRRREVTSARKAYFLDNGLRNALVGGLHPHPADRGARAENWVFTELAKALPWEWTLRYWRSAAKAEVDFVVDAPPGLLGIEVKAGSLARPKLARSSRSFIQAYSPRSLWVVNASLSHEATVEGCQVEWIPAWRLPEALASWRG